MSGFHPTVNLISQSADISAAFYRGYFCYVFDYEVSQQTIVTTFPYVAYAVKRCATTRATFEKQYLAALHPEKRKAFCKLNVASLIR